MRTAHSWRRWWPAVMAALVLVGLWALTLASPDEPARVVAAPRAAPFAGAGAPPPAPDAFPAAAAVATAAVAVVAAPVADLPPGVTPEQWAAIEAEMTQRPDALAELQRLRAYLQWSDALRRFREARAAGLPATEQMALAQVLEQGLGERIRGAEVSAAEARQIEGAILELTVADDVERSERLRQWAATELAPAAAADPRQAAFERRQVEIVAAWSALPPAARDRAALERELEDLRQQSFSRSVGTR
ncbi:MAG: hypothetical protein ABIQ06_15230 [Caldimonas sp.]